VLRGVAELLANCILKYDECLRKPALIHMRYAGPVVVSEDRCSRDLIVLVKLKAADLADLPIGHLDLGVVAEDNRHSLLSDLVG